MGCAGAQFCRFRHFPVSELFTCIKFPNFFSPQRSITKVLLGYFSPKEARSLTQRSDLRDGGFKPFVYSRLQN